MPPGNVPGGFFSCQQQPDKVVPRRLALTLPLSRERERERPEAGVRVPLAFIRSLLDAVNEA